MTTNFNPFPAVYGVATTVVGYAAAHQSTIASYALGVATTVAVKAAYDQWNRVLPKEITPQERLDQEIKKLFIVLGTFLKFDTRIDILSVFAENCHVRFVRLLYR